MDKNEIVKIFDEIALLLEIKEENPFKIRAYRKAAHSLLNMDEDLQKVIDEGRLTSLEGIGKDLAEKITHLVRTGHLESYEELKKSTPEGLLELMKVYGLGSKRIIALYKTLKIQSVDALKQACLRGDVAQLKGFGTKTEKNILDSIAHLEQYQKRHLWWNAMTIASPILEGLQNLREVKKAEIAGSLRRNLETIGDLDFLVASPNPEPIIEWFTSQSFVNQVFAKGTTKASIRLESGIQADLRIVSEKQFGFALCYSTGSKEHNIKLRQRAQKRGWTLSEWGLESVDPKQPSPFEKKRLAVTEKDLYHILELDYIPPELREDQGEIEAAAKKKLPKLVEAKDIRGAFHIHTAASDGKNTLLEMVSGAQDLGWEYIGIADHSKSSVQANGLSEERLWEQLNEIKKLNASKKFTTHIFAGTECDILFDGSLDFPDDLLKELDFVVVSVHASLQLDEKTMTKRIIRAVEHPYTTMVGHVTGRLLLRREPYAVNVSKVIDACIKNNKIIELNVNPKRQDMDWRLWRAASEKGLKCCINPDAHSVQNLQFVSAGIGIARKGWLEKKKILNTYNLKDVMKFLKNAKGKNYTNSRK